MTDTNPSQTTRGTPAREHLALLYRLSQTFNSSLNLDQVLNLVMDEVIAATGAERGFVMLREADGQLDFRVARGLDQGAIDDLEFEVSRSIVEGVVRDGEAVLTGDAQLDESLRDRTSVMLFGLRSILCVPLKVKGEVLGAIYVDNRLQAGTFDEDDLELLAAIASSAAIAIENARLYSESQRRAAELEALQRISLQITSSLDLTTALESVTESVVSLVGAADCLIYLYDEVRGRFTHGTASGRWAATGEVLPPRRDGLTAAVLREGGPVVVEDTVGHPLYSGREVQGWDVRAVVGLPLLRAKRILGVLHAVFGEPRTFRQEELRALSLLADQAAIAVDNARLFEAERAQLQELTVLHAVATAGAKATREDALIERVTQIIGETLYPAEVFGVLLLDAAANALHAHPSYTVAGGKEDLWQAVLGQRFRDDAGRIVIPLGQGVTGAVAASGQSRRIGDVTGERGYIDLGTGTRSELCVPLKVGERVLGVINAESPQPDAFSEADERLLATVAGQLATAIEKLRLYQAAQQEIAERRQAEAELRRLRDLNEDIVQNMVEGIFVLDADGYFTLANPAMASLLGCEIDELVAQHWTAFVPPDQRPMVETAVERHVRGQSDRYEVQLRRKDGTRVLTQVSGSPRLDPDTGRFVGTMGIFTDLTERVRVEEELRQHRDHLEELVELRTAALTQANEELAREVGERKKVEAEIRRQKEYFEALFLNNPVAVVTADLKGKIVSWNPRAEALFGYSQDEVIGRNLDNVVANDEAIRAEAVGYTEQVNRLGRVRSTTQRIRKDGSRVDVELLALPVTVAGENIGFIAIYYDITERVQAEAERERMLAAERAQARRQSALLRLSAELAAALDEDEICRCVVDGLRDTLNYDFVAFLLQDQATGDRVLAAAAGPVVPPHRVPSGQGLSERPLLDGQLHYTPDVSQEPDYIYWMGGSEVDVPVRIAGEVRGVLVIENGQRHAFGPDDFEVLTAAAQQAGLAIEKSRLLTAERRRADELEALRTTMTDVTGELELSALLQVIIERAVGLLDATGGEVALWDEASQEMQVVISHNLGGDYVGARHALGEGAFGHVAETGQPLIIEDYRSWVGRAPQYAEGQIHAVLTAPLEVGGRLVGAISSVTADPDRQFTTTDLHLLSLFAQQAAIAIENARLFGETERRVAELATLTEVGQALASSLRVDEVLQLVYEQTRRVMYAETMIIMFYDQERDEILVAFSRVHEDAVPGKPFPNTGLAGYVIKNRKPVLLRRDVIEGIHELGIEVVGVPSASFLAVPMLSGDRVLGVIILQHYDTPDVYDESHKTLLETIASQAAIAIENARLYADLRASQEYARNLIDSSLDPIIAVDRERKIVEFNRAAHETFGYEREEILGQHVDVLYARPTKGDAVHQATIEVGAHVREVMNRRKNGELFPSIVSASVLRDAQGELVGVMGISRDITERKRAEEELRRYQEHLEDLVEARTAELRESEERYRTLFDGVPVGLYRTTPEGQIVDANPANVQLLGYASREDLLAVNSASLYVDPEERLRWRALMSREGVVRDFETRMYKADGAPIWVNNTARAVLDDEGHLLYYEGSIEDITERKRAEEELHRYQEHLEDLVEARTAELRESEERYRTLFDGVPVGLYRSKADGEILDGNLAAAQMLGYPSREDMLATNIGTMFVRPREAARARLLADRKGIVRDFESRLRKTDGTAIWINYTARAVRDDDDQVLYYEGSLQDITERKKAEAELRDSEKRYRTLFDGVPVGLYRTTPEGQILDANPAAVQMLGYPSREELLQVETGSLFVDRREATRARILIDREGVVRDYESRLYRHDGTVMWTNYTARAVRDAQGQVLYYEGSLQDITSRKEAEEELRQHRERLAELVEERTAELRESEERYRTLFDGVPTGLYRSTPEGQLLDVNPAMVQMLGYASREDLLAVRSPDLYVDPKARERWGELMAQEGVVRDFECHLRTNDGRVIWAEDTARAMRDEQGQVLYYEGSVEDITERKQAEAELQEYQEHLEDLVEERTAELRASEERYRTLFDGVPVGLYRTTPDGQVLDANQGFVQMAGYPDRETLLAINTGSFYVDPEQQVQWKALMEQAGIVRDFEAQGRCYDGTVIWFSDSARAVRDQDGEVLYYEGSLEDITERKSLEEEIRRQKEYFEALFVGSPAAAMTTDMEANIASWNPRAEKLFGYTQEEAVGRHVDDLVASDPDIRDEAREYTAQAISEGRFQATARRTRKDGSYVDVEVSVLPVVVGGERTGFVATYHDISELQQARREAEAANQAKSVFLANMSHELRTPLNAILGFSQLMEGDANLTAEQAENIGIINRSGEHLLALINDVLEMSKIEAGRLAAEENSFDLHELLDGLEQMFRLRAEAKGLTMTFRRPENVPRYVAADEGKLRQVLGNLLGNAVKFTQEGGIALRVSGTDLREPPDSWILRFEVEDSGPGIAPEDLEIVFEPFMQATSGPPQEGTGLGLSISRQFARLMGGDLAVRSELGQGSLFRFDVRVALSESAEVEEREPMRQIAGLAPDQRAPDGRPYRLLVAEDRETNRLLLVRLLQPLGFEVREASNGQEAVELWEAWRPHLIWMDMRMPVMDGSEATRRIKAMPGGQDTVIVALTATVFEEDRERILLEGCDDFVRKPFRKDEIYDALAQHLGVRFVYEEEPALPEEAEPPAAAPPPGYVLSAQALAALPAELLAELQQATIRADLHQILNLVEQIRAQDPVLAKSLSDLAENYDYQRILELIQEAGRA